MVHQGMMTRLTGKHVTNIAFYLLMGTLAYFIWCDISFHVHLAKERRELLNSNKTIVSSEYSVKLRMLSPRSQYLCLPLCNWLNRNMGLSELPWMSANLVTTMHLIVAVCSARFFGSSLLSFRRIACILFEIRSCLDVMDGVIYRAQKGTTTFVSVWGSMGYMIDAVADVFGSFSILLGTMYRYNKCPPLKQITNKPNKHKGEEKESKETGGEVLGVERHSRRYAFGLCLFIAVNIGMRRILWDNFQKTYHQLLGVPRTDISARKQMEVLNYPSTWLCQWLWRVHSGDAFLTFTLIAMFFDKLWRWIRFSLYAAIPNLVIFGGITQLHVVYVRSFLTLTHPS